MAVLHKFLFLVAGCALAAAVIAQPIYKSVDEHGNVTYTDQPPADGSAPIDLPELSVVESADLGNLEAARRAAAQAPENDEPQQPAEIVVPEIRIASPSEEETIVNTGYVLPVRVAVNGEIPPGAQFVYAIDGEVRLTSPNPSVAIDEVFRGEHTLQVQLRSAEGQPLAQTQPVRFFMRQMSAQFSRPGN